MHSTVSALQQVRAMVKSSTLSHVIVAEAEAAVQAVKSVDTLEIMGKLLYNCAVTPKEEKFRRIKLTNKKIADTIGATAGAIDALLALGWEYDDQSPQELVVRPGIYFSMKEV